MSFIPPSDYGTQFSEGGGISRLEDLQVEYIAGSNLTEQNLSLIPAIPWSPELPDIDCAERTQKVADKIIQAIAHPPSFSICAPCGRNPIVFGVLSHSRANPDESGGWGRRVEVYYSKDLFFVGYALAILRFSQSFLKPKLLAGAFPNQDYPHIDVIKDATKAKDYNQWKQNVVYMESIERVVEWLKAFKERGATYEFDKKDLPQIQRLFKRVGMKVNLAKGKDEFAEDLLENIFVRPNSYAELVQTSENTVACWFEN